MNPMATVLSAMVAAAAAAPTGEVTVAATAPVHAVHAPLAFAGHHIAAPALGYAHHAVAAPVALPAAAPISVPAPYTTSQVQGADVVSIAQAPQQISKQVHYGQQTYVSGYNTQILKPAIPDISIAVPTALKGTQQINPAVVTVQKEDYVVNEPVHVEKPYPVHYDVIKPVEQIVEVPVAVEKRVPYAVPHPYPVRGQDIVKVTRTAPIVKNTFAGHHVAAPAFAGHHVAAPAFAGAYAHGAYAAAAPAGFVHHATPVAAAVTHA